MRPTLSLLGATAGALLLCAPSHAQLGPGSAPITYAADAVQMVEAENLVIAQGRVNVRQGEARLAADEMRIFLSPTVEGQVDRIEADGSVIYVTPGETARGDRGVYTAADERIRLTGRVRLIRGGDAFCSQELVIQPRLNQFEAVGGGAADDPLCAGRVRGVISAATASSAGEASSGGGDR